MKAILMAGGKGTRLDPLTRSVNKHLLPIYNKPMIYYPLANLMLAEIRDFLIITQTESIPLFQKLLGNGEDMGIRIQYAVQDQPNGISEAFLIGEEFIGDDSICLCLGDNLFFGAGFGLKVKKYIDNLKRDDCVVYVSRVNDPERYGILEIDDAFNPIRITEKPENPTSRWAITGLYVYGADVVQKAKTIGPSPRGELEISDINKLYLKEEKLNVELLGRGFCWLDMGTIDSLLDASDFVRTIEKRQGFNVCDPYEVATNNGWIS